MSARRMWWLAALAALAASPVLAYDPPAGGDGTGFLLSPVFLAGSLSVASDESSMADALNPAASGGLQRVTLDLNYAGLAGLGAEPGWGSAINLGLAVPKPYGVWSASLGLLSSPFASMPLGTAVTGRVGMAKDVYEDLYLGASADLTLGGNGGLGWGFGFDLGAQGLLGTVGFMKDFRWGLAIRNMGIAYDPPGDAGISGGAATGFESPFTLAAGAAATLVSVDTIGLTLDANVDLWFPGFQNAALALGLQLGLRESAFLRLGWDFNLAEALKGSGQSLLPSFGIGASFAINREADDSYISKSGWDRSEIRPSLAAHELYDGIWAFGGGVTLPLGVVDTQPPKISVTYPETPYGLWYMSPNSDGAKDDILLPISIVDQRYIRSYELKILDAEGKLVRRIANKDARPESSGIKSFISRLAYVKKGIDIPESLAWNGLADSGELAPDGLYSFVLEAADDNGNVGSSERYELRIDTAAPAVKASGPAGADALVFSPDGDGNKDAFAIAHEGSVEDLWKAELIDAAGTTVRSWEIKDAAPQVLTWDGKDASGAVVPDGVYAYRISAVDRAGNAGSAKVENIIVNTQQPPVAVSIDLAAFSPNGDGAKDTLTLGPNVPVRAGLATWSLAVVDAAGKDVWSVSGAGSAGLAPSFVFNGKDASGKALPEGQYRTRLNVTYVNGHAPVAWSPQFVIDLTPPRAAASVDRTAFNPLGATRLDVTVTQSGSDEERWQGQIVDAAGAVVKTWAFIGSPDASVRWDGSDDSGKTVPDGQYVYRLSATDRAGNAGSASAAAVTVDTEKKAVRLSPDKRAFSPNGDGVNETVTFSIELTGATRVSQWTLSIADASGVAVRTFKGTAAPPARQSWDGKADSGSRAPDGSYVSVLEVSYITGDVEAARSVELALDTVAPAIRLSVPDTLFSPNGDGRKDALQVRQDSDAGDSWEGRVTDAAGKTVKSWTWKDKAADFEWDGADASGNPVPDGTYRYVVSSSDAAGNKTERAVDRIVIDTKATQVFVTASAAGFSPNGDKLFDDLSFGLIVNNRDGIASWKLAIVDAAGVAVRTYAGTGAASIPARQAWDGKADAPAGSSSAPPAAQGAYTARFTVDYLKGDRAEAASASFTLDTEGPKATLVTSPRYFSPDNDGVDDELRISLAVADASSVESWKFEIFEVAVVESAAGKRTERSFFAWTGKGKPAERLAWDGRSQRGELVQSATDYPYRFTITDELGNATTVEGLIQVDVLVIRDGERLRVMVPSIVFRPDFADFKDLPKETVDRNLEVLQRIALILNRFAGYKIRVEGHANSISKMTKAPQAAIDKEENSELLPLSLARATAVMQKLIEYGVDAKRLSVRGLGSSEPIVPFTDEVNRWKNRRVEFILIKE